MILALSLLVATALAAEPTPATITSPTQPTEHIRVLRGNLDEIGPFSNVSVTISCSKPGLDYTSEPKALNDALMPVSAMNVIVAMEDATNPEITAWFSSLADQLDGKDPFRLLVVSISCPATGGDEDLAVLGNGLAFSGLAKAVRPIAASSLWFLDTSREGYGVTAYHVAHADLPDAFAVSTGAPGKIAPGGLIGAAAKVIEANGGNALSLDGLYYTGIKPKVSNLELYTSAGINAGNMWDGNGNRMVLPAAPLIVPITDVKPPTVARRQIPKGCWVAGAGVLTMIGGSILAGEAGGHYNALVDYNEYGGVTQEQLTAEINAYKLDTGLAIGIGALGVLMTAGGVTWTVVDHNHRTITATPVGVSGTFQ